MEKIPWSRAWQPTPVFLPGESHGQKNVTDYSPQGRKETVTTEATERARVQKSYDILNCHYQKFLVEQLSVSDRIQIWILILSSKENHSVPGCTPTSPTASSWMMNTGSLCELSWQNYPSHSKAQLLRVPPHTHKKKLIKKEK